MKPRKPKHGGDLPRQVGSIFRNARQLQRLSQEQVAALTEDGAGRVSRTMISAIERGRSLPGLEALVSLSRALHVEPGEVLDRVDAALAVPVDMTGRTAEQLLQEAERHFLEGDFRRAVATYDAAAEHLILDPPADESRRIELEASVAIDRAVALRRCGALTAAQNEAQRAVELAARATHLRCEAYMALAAVLSQRGLHVLAADASDRAVAAAETAGARRPGQAWNQRGSILHRAGDFGAAYSAFAEARKLAVEAGDRRHAIKIEGNLGACLLDLGRRKQAAARFVRAIELAREERDAAAEAFWVVELGRVALEDGRLEDAERYARAAAAIARTRDLGLTLFRAEWLAHLVVRRRDPAAPDRQRLALLKRMWGRFRGHRGLEPVREFENAVIRPGRDQET